MFTKETIREMLETNDTAIVRGILAIYAKQTADEQSSMTTNKENGVGFNGTDAGILSSFAVGISKYGSLTEKQMAIARRKIMKYAGQLARIANERIAA